MKKMLKNMAIAAIANLSDLKESDIDNNVNEITKLPMFSSLTNQDVIDVINSIKSDFSIKLDEGILLEEKGHEKWFLDRKAQLDMAYWERYKQYLLNDKGFSARVVNKMDDVLDTLTDLLGDPTRDLKYARKGLIIGDVQSGKTANYTGLICKAVDAGYKAIVLLTGTIESLRQQTQERIDEGFVGAYSDAIIKQREEGLIVGVGKYNSSLRPMVLTSTTDDFKKRNATTLGFDLRNIQGSVIFVLKKNSSVLKTLNNWMNPDGNTEINNSLLVIDDESDNASINTKDEDSPTAINGHIRKLLNTFTKSCYVGFTATPYANIFIDPDSYNDINGENLFPKDFIYSLNAPSNYTGARDIYGLNGDASYMLKLIDTDLTNRDSIEFILPLKHKNSTRVTRLPEDLKNAIETFLLANTIEDLMGLSNNHRSMLINVSRFTAVQNDIAALVNDYLKDLQSACKLYGKLDTETAIGNESINRLRNTFVDTYLDCSTYSWEDVQASLYSSCAPITVATINGSSSDRLNYDDYKNGRRVIAVGGMSLSRGLTLEGLVVSYFYRNSKMYDTLMQMGRWFGYRGKYAELCRIWMSEDSIEWYRQISEATDELRDEIKRYHDTGLTPLEFGLRVRNDSMTLIVTALNKMRSAERHECIISLSSETVETPELYSSKDANIVNFDCVNNMLVQLSDAGIVPVIEKSKTSQTRYAIKDVPSSYIAELLDNVEISPRNERFNPVVIKEFIKDYNGKELDKWDVYFASGEGGIIDFSCGISFNKRVRSYSVDNDGKIYKMMGSKRRLGTNSDGRLGITQKDIEYVKVLVDKKEPAQRDYFKINRKPLLVVYAIDLKEENESIIKEPVIGFGIGIPKLSDKETRNARYVLNKIAIQKMFGVEEDELSLEEE